MSNISSSHRIHRPVSSIQVRCNRKRYPRSPSISISTISYHSSGSPLLILDKEAREHKLRQRLLHHGRLSGRGWARVIVAGYCEHLNEFRFIIGRMLLTERRRGKQVRICQELLREGAMRECCGRGSSEVCGRLCIGQPSASLATPGHPIFFCIKVTPVPNLDMPRSIQASASDSVTPYVTSRARGNARHTPRRGAQ